METKKPVEQTKTKSQRSQKSIFKSRGLIRVVVLNSINAVLLIGIIIFLFKFPQKARDIKELKNSIAAQEATVDLSVARADIENSRSIVAKIESMYPDDTGVFRFISAVAEMKNQGLITEFNIADNPVKNNQGLLGLPVQIKMEGSRAQVAEALVIFETMPFLMVPIQFEAEKLPEDRAIFIYETFLLVR